MKKLISTLSLVCLLAFVVCAQECNTGPSSCTVLTNLPPWFSPVSDSLPPAIDTTSYSSVIHIHIPDSITIGALSFGIDSLHFDTIANLPFGICWETSDSNNTFASGHNGCIGITGTSTASPGQYKLYIAVDVYIPNKMHILADAAGLFYYVRVNCDAPNVWTRAIDTSGTGAGQTYWAYSTACDFIGAIKTVDENIRSLNVYPNPFTNQAEVSFNSLKNGMMTERITNVIGSEVSRNSIDVTYGANSYVINRSNLTAGIYFYTISDGITTFSQKLIIQNNE